MPEDKQNEAEVPVNPEMEAVAANQPASAEASTSAKATADASAGAPKGKPGEPVPKPGEPPKKIAKEKKKPSRGRFLIGCAGGLMFLFVLFVVLMVLMMSRAGGDNPVMRAFGVDPVGVKSFLMTIISLAFGSLALLFFVLMVVGLFRMLGAKKSDKETRGKGVKMIIFSLIPFVLVVFIWYALYNFIARIQIEVERVVAEIVIVAPKSIKNLQAPVEITFSAANVAKALTMGGFAIESMNWDLDGNGEFELPVTQPEIVHLYNRRGTYEIGLQVKIAGEETYRPPYTTTIVIAEAVFRAEPATGDAPLDVQFDANTLIPKGVRVQSIDWDFDDDGFYELEGRDNKEAAHRFEKIGTYNVHLRIVDQNNNVENYYREIVVKPSDVPLLTAEIQAAPSKSGPIPLRVRFDGGQSQSLKGKIIKYEWDFDDGSALQVGKSVSHIFNDPGTYTVTLTVEEDSGKTDQTSITIKALKISSVPEAVISTDPPYSRTDEGDILSGVLPFKVIFDASKSTDEDNDIVDFQWDFDSDGVIDFEGKKGEHVFDAAGTYETTLTVRDTEDQSGTATLKVEVAEPEVKAVINADPGEGVVPLVVQFDGSSSSTFEGSIVSFEWDFGDGSEKTITGATVSHRYETVGTYETKLKVLTSENESAETSQLIYVREVPLFACFEPSRDRGKAPLAVTFDTKCSTGAIAAYKWDFGDGEDSDSRKPTHTFEEIGEYTVHLEVTDDKNNVSTYSEVITAEGELAE